MTKTELIAQVATKMDVTKKLSGEIVDAVVEAIVDGAKTDGEVSIAKFGKFVVKDVPARTARNPLTGESVEVAPKKKITFKPSSVLKDAVQ